MLDMSKSIGKHLSELETPCLVVDKAKVEENCARMVERCRQLGVSLRPHMKTSKTIEAGVLMTNNTKRCIVVSTLAEAEFFANAAFDDILFGKSFTEDKMPRCPRFPRLIELRQRLDKFSVMVDSEEAIALLEKHFCPDRKWMVFLEVDAGHGRAGVPWNSEKIVVCAKRLSTSSHISFEGLYTHDGNSYEARDAAAIRRIGDSAADAMLDVASRLKGVGVACDVIGQGSTPSCSAPGPRMGALTEFHPGNYVFYDAMQMRIGSCDVSNVASRVMTRVTGHFPERNEILVDCGWTAISLDGKGELPNDSFCLVQDHPHLGLVRMTQEIGVVRPGPDAPPLDFACFPLGSTLFLLPYHSCASSAMHAVYYVHDGAGRVVEEWRPCRGW